MKFLIILILFSFNINAQTSSSESISLEKYVPTFSFQEGVNCYAYATVYIALTTQLAYEYKIQNPDSSFAFSYEFVDKLIKYKKRKEKGFVKNVSRVLYNSDSPLDLGDLDYTFYVLYRYGGKKFNEYNGERITDKNIKNLIRFSKPTEIFTPEENLDIDKISLFKKYLKIGKPIIICINQPQANCNRWIIDDKITESKIKHIVTIIGYKDNDFLIQNNYGGSECRYYYTSQEIEKFLSYAYVYENPLVAEENNHY